MGAIAARLIWRAVVVLVVLFVPFATRAAPAYTISHYAEMGDSPAFTDLNDNGVAVGYYFADDGSFDAFQSDGNSASRLSGLSTSYHEAAAGVNSAGVAVGFASLSSSSRAVQFGNPTFDLLPSSSSAGANAINDSGQVVGASGPSNSRSAFLLTNGTFQDLGKLPGKGYSEATAINASGQVAGISGGSPGSSTQKVGDRGFIWTNGTLTDLGFPTGFDATNASVSLVEGINDNGWVTGSWQQYVNGVPQLRRAFIYRNGVVEDLLPTLQHSDAYDINNFGQIVGLAQRADQSFFSFLWDGGQIYDLQDLVDPASGWIVDGVEAINNNGQILGVGFYKGNYTHFLLSPAAAPIPVPAAVWLFGSGLAALAGMRRRRSPDGANAGINCRA